MAFLGYTPLLAPKTSDSAEIRLRKIYELIETSSVGIHDLSRSKASIIGEYYRLNMPFELGIHMGYRRFGQQTAGSVKILVLESTRYDYQKAISDLAGCDIKAHSSKPTEIVKCVRDWFVETIGMERLMGPTGIWNRFNDFMYDLHKFCIENGYSEEDFDSISIADYLQFLDRWVAMQTKI